MTTKELKFGNLISDKVYIARQMELLGFDKHYTGFFMLVDILNILINNKIERLVSFSRQVYPIVAKRFNVNDYTIERNIRNLIDKCWNEELMIKLNISILNKNKPKCQKFIFIIKSYLENCME